MVVVRGFPDAQADGRGIEVAESVAAPEFFLVDSMTAFHLAVLLGPSRPDVAMTNPQCLHRQREGQGKLLPVIALQLADTEGVY